MSAAQKVKFVWKDRKSWTPLLKNLRGRQTIESIEHIIWEHFDIIELFHGGRPKKVDAYYREGIRIADQGQLTEAARKIFVSANCPDVSGSDFEKAIEDTQRHFTPIDDHKLFLTLDDRAFFNGCGHYLIYGSEHICGLAARLQHIKGPDYRQILKRWGIPTIFRLAVPLSIVPEYFVKDLADTVRGCLARVRAGSLPSVEDFTITLGSDLPAHCVIDHYHPKSIPDPLLYNAPYHYEDRSK
jgi:hypothetical protein